MTAPIDLPAAEAHARRAVTGHGSVVATSVVAALLDEIDRLRAITPCHEPRCTRCPT